MKTPLLLRMASGCTLFFVVGHSLGHFTWRNGLDPAVRKLLRVTEEVLYAVGTEMRTYDECYTGMSFNLIISLLTLTALLWIAAGLVAKEPVLTRKILWPVLFCLSLFSLTSFLYFFPVPGFTCLTASGLIVVSLVRLQKYPAVQDEQRETDRLPALH